MRNTTCTQTNRGFTLIEMIVTIILIGLLAGAGTGMITNSFKMNKLVSDETVALADARYAIERITRETREITIDPATGTYGITGTSPLVFTKSYNGVPSTYTLSHDTSNKQIMLTRISGLETRGPVILIDNVSNLTITYYDASMLTLASPVDITKIRAAKIEFTVSPTGVTPINMVSYIALRNTT